MQGSDQLSLIAELGTGFAGFIAIFLIFARREGRFTPADSFRVRSLLTSSFQAVFYALFPLAFSLYGLSESSTWRAASMLAIVIGGPVLLHFARVHLSLTPEERAEVGRIHSLIAWSLSVAAGALFIATAAAPASDRAPALYVSALICSLGVATSNFITIALKRLL